MLISFELSMPGVGSCNGKWSGADKCYVVVRYFKKNTPKLGYYEYNFGDGWRAGIAVREVTSATARKLRKQSSGFYGYDWMIDSIIQYGKIMNNVQRREFMKESPDDPNL